MATNQVLLADDNRRARDAVRMLLEADSRFCVVGEAVDGDGAIRLARELQPDIVLMDINMPGVSGIEATRRIKMDSPRAIVVILSVSDDAGDLFEAIRAGAQGYLIKSLHPTDWIAYLHSVLDGESPLPRKMAARILAEFHAPLPESDAAAARLTQREREILALVTEGATNREVAARLFISENTVKNHVKNILEKLRVQNRTQLAALAAGRMGANASRNTGARDDASENPDL